MALRLLATSSRHLTFLIRCFPTTGSQLTETKIYPMGSSFYILWGFLPEKRKRIHW